MAMKKKPSLGRQKIPTDQKIPKKNHRQVTFSKRKAGIFKKASELCTLCGVEIAIIVFSPADKPFSFGHPDVDSIIQRFPSRNNAPTARHFIEAHRNAIVRELNLHLTDLGDQLEIEKKRGEALDEMLEATRRGCWWAAPVERLGLRELEQLKMALEELKTNVGTFSQMLGDVPATSAVDSHNYLTGYGKFHF